LYDADGLMADERADFDGWSRTGEPYNMLRRIEAAAVRRSDVVVTRTRHAGRLLARRAGLSDAGAAKIAIVSNGKDAELFHPADEASRREMRASLGISFAAPLVVYVGSLGPQYHLDRMIAFFADVHARCPSAHLLVLASSLEHAAAAAALSTAVTIKRVEPSSVPRYLAAADLGLAFRTPSLSQRAVAPIKVGEYLLCGVPVLSTCGIGDLDEQLDRSVGFLLDGLSAAELSPAIDWFLDDVLPSRDAYRRRCRQRGLELFDLDRAVEQYQHAFAAVRRRARGALNMCDPVDGDVGAPC
jgi:glycosyltransferase involved in cell wall biosynthesis